MTFGKVRSGTNRKTVRILLLGGVMLLGSGLTASATESVFDHPVQERAFPPTLQALGAGLQKHRTIRSQFTQTKKISILQHPLVTQGNLLYAPEHGVYWQTTSPFASEVVITPEGYFQRKKGRLVSQIPASASSGAQGYLKAFLLVFSGDFQNLQTLFSLSFLHSNQAWAVGLSSKDQLKKIIESIEISGELPAVLKLIIIRETNGDLTRIELHGINHSTAPLSPTELQFFE